MGDATVAEINGCEAIVTVFPYCMLGSVEDTKVVGRTFSGRLSGVVEGAEVIVMTLLLSAGLMAACPLVKSQCSKTSSSRNEELTLMGRICVVPPNLDQVLHPPRQLEKGLQTKQAERNTFSNLDSLRLNDLIEETCRKHNPLVVQP